MIPMAIRKQRPMTTIWTVAALSSLSWNDPMDELALENKLKSLEMSWGSLDRWLKFWILLVVIGVAVELVVILVEYFRELHDFRRGIIHAPDRPSAWLLVFALLGAGLVALGVAGEFFIHIKAGRIETEMRDASAPG
jgi:H+/Cl- antiporter ClcA